MEGKGKNAMPNAPEKMILANLLGRTIYIDVVKEGTRINFTLRAVPIFDSYELRKDQTLTVDCPSSYEIRVKFNNGTAVELQSGLNSDGDFVLRLEPHAN